MVKEKRARSEAILVHFSYALGLPYPRYECCRLLLETISTAALRSSRTSWTRGIMLVRRPSAFSTAKASLGYDIVETLALITHTIDDPMIYQHVLRRLAGIGPAAIHMLQ